MEEGLTAYIVAGGPSLADFDFSFLEDKNVIAINNAFLKVPAADVCYFSDLDWFERWKDQLKQHPGRKIRGHLPDKQINVDWVEEWLFTQERGLVLDPRCLAHGFNSGAAAINLAVQLGYRKLFLLGYDMQIVEGRTNFHSDHTRTTPRHAYTNQFIPAFEAMVQPLRELGVEVFNATPGSALKVFPVVLGFTPRYHVIKQEQRMVMHERRTQLCSANCKPLCTSRDRLDLCRLREDPPLID